MNKNPGWLFDIGDCTTQLCEDFAKPFIRIPVNQPVFHGMSMSTGFLNVAQIVQESQMVYLVASMMCMTAIQGLSSQLTVPGNSGWTWSGREGGREGGRESCVMTVMTDLVLVKGVLSC